MLALIWMLASAPALADIPVGAEVDNAVVADITKTGFDTLAGAIPMFVPDSVEIPPVHLYDEGGCILGACAWSYQFDATDGFVLLSVPSVNLTPATDVLNFDAQILVTINTPSSPMDIYARATGLGIPISADCDVWVETFPVDLNASVHLQVVGGELQATMTPLQYDLGVTDNHIKVSGCSIDTINTVLNFFGWSLYGYIIDIAEGEIDKVVQDMDVPALVEGVIEDAFAQANFEDTFELMGKELDVALWPETVQITQNGVRVGVTGRFDTDVDPCVSRFGIEGARATPSTLPGVGATPSGLPFPASAAVYADDDFLNSALFTVWSSGLLCYDLPSNDLDLPLPMDTSLLGLLAGDLYDDLFPKVQPIRILTRPEHPPEVFVGLGNDANLLVDPLGLEIYTELDGRLVRIANLDLAVDAGADLSFNPSTGVLGIDVAFDGGRITPTATFSDLVPEAGEEMEKRFLNIFGNLVEPLLGDALSGFSFPLPAFEGIGLSNLSVRPAGSADDRLGVYAAVGTSVPYYDPNAEGCGCDSDSEGCDTGCTTGGLPARGLMALFPLVLAMLRRRQS